MHLHCFALDGASQHLFAPYGTNSLSDPEDFKIMEEMSYADSLRGLYLTHPPETYNTDILKHPIWNTMHQSLPPSLTDSTRSGRGQFLSRMNLCSQQWRNLIQHLTPCSRNSTPKLRNWKVILLQRSVWIIWLPASIPLATGSVS